jgi:hypothetical protein
MAMTLEALVTEHIPVSYYTVSFAVAVLETAVFARLLLKPLLADRNEILARSILDQRELYASDKKVEEKQGGWFNLLSTNNNQKKKAISSDEQMTYAPGSAMSQK